MLNVQDYTAKTWLWIAAILFIIAYYFAPSAPFYLDDFTSIVENPRLRSATSFNDIFSAFGMRTIGYYTLWLDFQLYGADAADSARSFRWTNLAIHSVVVLAVYIFLRQVLRRFVTAQAANGAAALLAIVYLVHPLNIQAVTYVVQRITSLAALFSIISVLGYYQFRTANRAALIWGLLALLTFALAVMTKQNTVVVPIIWYATERFVIRPHAPWKKDLIGLIVVSVIAVVVAITFWPTIDALTTETENVTRLQYFLAQGPILWIYAFKFFIPINLHLEYSFGINSFPLWVCTVAWLAHAGVIVGALKLLAKQPLLTFGIAWFYIAHSVESSVIPIKDFAFEHRTYLPNVGLLFAFSTLCSRLIASKRVGLTVIPLVVILMFTAQSAHRNYQWANHFRFYDNELSHNPQNYRVMNETARYAVAEEEFERAADIYRTLIEERGIRDEAILINAIVANAGLKDWEKVIALEEMAFTRIEQYHPSYRARLQLNRGIRLKETGQCDAAYEWFAKVQQAFPGEFSSLLFRTQCDVKTGNTRRANQTLEQLIKVAPNEPRVIELRQQLDNK